MTRFWTNDQVEARAEARVAEYERRFGSIAQPPVPLERLIDEVFDLRILWEPIEEHGAISPLAGLRPKDRRIVINELRRAELDDNPSLLAFTFAHELGHWDLHVDQAALSHPVLMGIEPDSGTFRHFRAPGGDVRVLLSRLHRMGFTATEAYEAVHELTRREDDFFQAHQANRRRYDPAAAVSCLARGEGPGLAALADALPAPRPVRCQHHCFDDPPAHVGSALRRAGWGPSSQRGRGSRAVTFTAVEAFSNGQKVAVDKQLQAGD